MQVLQTTLLTGPYDWDEAVLPREEFAARLAAVRAAMAAEGAQALLVHGHSGDYGALNYLTGFVPKLGNAVALVPASGPLRVLVSGTDLMLPWAKRLTWVEDVRTLANIAKLLPEWFVEAGLESPVTLAIWGGAGMVRALHDGVANGMRERGRIVALDRTLDRLRQRKTPRERALMQRACEILGAAVSALGAAARGGGGNRSSALAAERVAYGEGAQDVRVLVGARPGGMPMPLDSARDVAVDPLLAVIAVQYEGYWAEGLLTVTGAPRQAAPRATAALDAVLRETRAGVTAAALSRVAAAALAPCAPHRLTQASIGCAIGLSLEEAALGADDRLEPGVVYCLRVGAQATDDAAIASAMVAVDAVGTDILWRSPA